MGGRIHEVEWLGSAKKVNKQLTAAEVLSLLICGATKVLPDWTSDLGPDLKAAQRKLADFIGSGKLPAYGRATPHGLKEPVPPELFNIRGVPVVVGPHGDMASLVPHKKYHGPIYTDIEFESEDVRKLFPAVDVMAVMMSLAEQEIARTGQPGKREDLIKRTAAAARCPQREAVAAHKNLPELLRRTRGNRSKSPNHFAR